MFDLSEAEGVNESERVLTGLCRKSFLRLWAHTNVFTDEGFKAGRGSAKELCDALVVFGKHVLIFSDKHITFQKDKPLDVAWPRWYRRAVVDSIRQLHGARNWLQRFPGRAFLDAACKRPLPVNVPSTDDVVFHLIAVTRGSTEAAVAFAGGHGRGTFGVDSALAGDAHVKSPFVLGRPMRDKPFAHVFDEVSIELVLSELDTAADFIAYLTERERFLGSSKPHVLAHGEEDLLAAYVQNMDVDEEKHQFLPGGADDEQPDLVMFDQTFYDELEKKEPYIRKKAADKISYSWDTLIDRFISVGDPNLHGTDLMQTTEDLEEGLRLLAGESRFRRRTLAQLLQGALFQIGPGQTIARLGYSGVAGETVYVFLIVPRRPDEAYVVYRRHRIALLHAYCRTAKVVAPLGTTFVGLAFDNPHQGYKGGSEDLFIFSQPEWSQQDLDEVAKMREELKLWGSTMKMSHWNGTEFPQAPAGLEDGHGQLALVMDSPGPRREKTKAEKSKMRREKMKKASQRKNRR